MKVYDAFKCRIITVEEKYNLNACSKTITRIMHSTNLWQSHSVRQICNKKWFNKKWLCYLAGWPKNDNIKIHRNVKQLIWAGSNLSFNARKFCYSSKYSWKKSKAIDEWCAWNGLHSAVWKCRGTTLQENMCCRIRMYVCVCKRERRTPFDCSHVWTCA